MRLNQTLRCPGCQTNVNPYVVENFDAAKDLQCPTCSENFYIRPNASWDGWEVHRGKNRD